MVMRRFFPSTINGNGVVAEYSVIYSLRNVSGWTGDVIQVRRVDDSTDEWFGYSGGVGTEINTSQISTFLGSSAGRVRQLKNTGNAGTVYDLDNNINGGPEIFNGTDFHFINGKLALDFSIGDVSLFSTTYPGSQSDAITDKNSMWSIVFESQTADESVGAPLIEGGTATSNNRNGIYSDTRDSTHRGVVYIADGSVEVADLDDELAVNEIVNIAAWKQGSVISCYKNGTLQADTGDSSAIFPETNMNMTLGVQRVGPLYFNGLLSEAVLDLTEDSTKRDNLISSQTSFYGIT